MAWGVCVNLGLSNPRLCFDAKSCPSVALPPKSSSNVGDLLKRARSNGMFNISTERIEERVHSGKEDIDLAWFKIKNVICSLFAFILQSSFFMPQWPYSHEKWMVQPICSDWHKTEIKIKWGLNSGQFPIIDLTEYLSGKPLMFDFYMWLPLVRPMACPSVRKEAVHPAFCPFPARSD